MNNQHQDCGSFVITLAKRVIKDSRVEYYDMGSRFGPHIRNGWNTASHDATPACFRELTRDAARQIVATLTPEDLGRIISTGVDLGQDRTSLYDFLRRHDMFQCRGSGIAIMHELAELIILARAWDVIKKPFRD